MDIHPNVSLAIGLITEDPELDQYRLMLRGGTHVNTDAMRAIDFICDGNADSARRIVDDMPNIPEEYLPVCRESRGLVGFLTSWNWLMNELDALSDVPFSYQEAAQLIAVKMDFFLTRVPSLFSDSTLSRAPVLALNCFNRRYVSGDVEFCLSASFSPWHATFSPNQLELFKYLATILNPQECVDSWKKQAFLRNISDPFRQPSSAWSWAEQGVSSITSTE